MNTRIQVEHTITEEVYGCDLVKEQIHIAAGERLSPHVAHADAAACTPSNAGSTPRIRRGISSRRPGKIAFYYAPGGRGVRIDSHAYTGYVVPPYYDSMIAKLITVGAHARIRDRIGCGARSDEYHITGIKTTIPFHSAIMRNAEFRNGNYDTGFVERFMNSDKFELIATPGRLHD